MATQMGCEKIGFGLRAVCVAIWAFNSDFENVERTLQYLTGWI